MNERTLRIIDSLQGYPISCLDGRFPGQKAQILCLHGFSGSKRSLVIERLHREMSSLSIGTFTFDWPAHGESRASYDDLRVENCIRDLETVLTYLTGTSTAPVFCFATSFGGYLAMLFHNRHPEVFDRILLRSPALRMAEILRSFMDESQLREFLQGSRLDFGFSQPLLLKQTFYEDLCAHDVFSAKPPHPEKIIILHGTGDDVVPFEHSLHYSDRFEIPLFAVEGANHFYDRPQDIDYVMEKAKSFYCI